MPVLIQLPMCDQCSKIYKTDKKHDPSICPIALSLTCSCCKIKGHSTLKCPRLDLWKSRVPEYMEQLIPFSLRIHHKIPFDQKTPISSVNLKPLPCPHIIYDLAKEKMENARNQLKGLPIVEKSEPQAYSELHCNQCRPTLEIPEDKDGSYTANIRATLASNNLPNSSGKENVKLLTNFAAMNGKKLILTKNIIPVQKDDNPQVQAQKKQIKCKKIQEKPAEVTESTGSAESEKQETKPKKILKTKQTSGKAT